MSRPAFFGGFVFSILFAPFAMGLDVPVQAGDQVLLSGVSAQVNYTVVPGLTVLRMTDPSSVGWSFDRRDRRVVIEGPGPGSRASVGETLRQGTPRVTLDIQGPSLPLEIHLRDGAVVLSKGSHDARISLQQGRVESRQRTGGLRVAGRKVDVTVAESSGRLTFDIYQGSVTLKNHQGDSEIELFAGQLVADQISGTMAATTHSASGKVQKFSGTLQLDLGKGPFTATGVQGRVEGQSSEGAVSLQILPDTEVDLRSQSGRVQVQVPAGTGGSVNLSTGGEILVPVGVSVARTPAEKVARGRLRGSGGRIQVTVRSVDGSIVVK